MILRDQKWKARRIIQQAENIHKHNPVPFQGQKCNFTCTTFFFSSIHVIISACKNMNALDVSFAWKSYAVTRKAQLPLCVHTRIRSGTNEERHSVPLSAWAYSDFISKRWFENQQPVRMQKPNVHAVIFWTTVRTFQMDQRDPESLKSRWLENQPISSCWYFSTPK